VRVGWRNRDHPSYWAFLVHRISGLLLSLFLPLHFWVLGRALAGEAALDGFLRWTERPLVKASLTCDPGAISLSEWPSTAAATIISMSCERGSGR